jgi:hypothetical protein
MNLTTQVYLFAVVAVLSQARGHIFHGEATRKS